jgi:hypothetical protein
MEAKGPGSLPPLAAHVPVRFPDLQQQDQIVRPALAQRTPHQDLEIRGPQPGRSKLKDSILYAFLVFAWLVVAARTAVGWLFRPVATISRALSV